MRSLWRLFVDGSHWIVSNMWKDAKKSQCCPHRGSEPATVVSWFVSGSESRDIGGLGWVGRRVMLGYAGLCFLYFARHIHPVAVDGRSHWGNSVMIWGQAISMLA